VRHADNFNIVLMCINVNKPHLLRDQSSARSENTEMNINGPLVSVGLLLSPPAD
jgi:hypothetical protein